LARNAARAPRLLDASRLSQQEVFKHELAFTTGKRLTANSARHFLKDRLGPGAPKLPSRASVQLRPGQKQLIGRGFPLRGAVIDCGWLRNDPGPMSIGVEILGRLRSPFFFRRAKTGCRQLRPSDCSVLRPLQQLKHLGHIDGDELRLVARQRCAMQPI
jgi:hypothetical protein